MLDPRDLANIRDYVAAGIENGMSAGATHIAAALADKKQDVAETPQYLLSALHGTTMADVMRAVQVVVRAHTRDDSRGSGFIVEAGTPRFRLMDVTEGEYIGALKTLRRALGMPT